MNEQPLVYENTILKTIQLARESVLKVGPKEIEVNKIYKGLLAL